jgi:hypothetical protein
VCLNRVYLAVFRNAARVTLWRPEDSAPWAFPTLWVPGHDRPLLCGAPHNIDDPDAYHHLHFAAYDLWDDVCLELLLAGLRHPRWN